MTVSRNKNSCNTKKKKKCGIDVLKTKLLTKQLFAKNETADVYYTKGRHSIYKMQMLTQMKPKPECLECLCTLTTVWMFLV